MSYLVADLRIVYFLIIVTSDSNIVMYHDKFKNIQTIIRVTKETTSFISGEVKTTTQYLIANFKDKTPHQFHDMILAHWRVESVP